MSPDVIMLGDIGLTGELKKVQSIETKIKEAERMGFKKIIIPEQNINGTYSIEIIKAKTIKMAIDKALFAGKEHKND